MFWRLPRHRHSRNMSKRRIDVIVDNATCGLFLLDQEAPGLRMQRCSGRPAALGPRLALMAEFVLMHCTGEEFIAAASRVMPGRET